MSNKKVGIIFGSWFISFINAGSLLSIEFIFWYSSFMKLMVIRTALWGILIAINMVILFFELKFTKLGNLVEPNIYLTFRTQIQVLLSSFLFITLYSLQYILYLFQERITIISVLASIGICILCGNLEYRLLRKYRKKIQKFHILIQGSNLDHNSHPNPSFFSVWKETIVGSYKKVIRVDPLDQDNNHNIKKNQDYQRKHNKNDVKVLKYSRVQVKTFIIGSKRRYISLFPLFLAFGLTIVNFFFLGTDLGNWNITSSAKLVVSMFFPFLSLCYIFLLKVAFSENQKPVFIYGLHLVVFLFNLIILILFRLGPTNILSSYTIWRTHRVIWILLLIYVLTILSYVWFVNEIKQTQLRYQRNLFALIAFIYVIFYILLNKGQFEDFVEDVIGIGVDLNIPLVFRDLNLDYNSIFFYFIISIMLLSIFKLFAPKHPFLFTFVSGSILILPLQAAWKAIFFYYDLNPILDAVKTLVIILFTLGITIVIIEYIMHLLNPQIKINYSGWVKIKLEVLIWVISLFIFQYYESYSIFLSPYVEIYLTLYSFLLCISGLIFLVSFNQGSCKQKTDDFKSLFSKWNTLFPLLLLGVNILLCFGTWSFYFLEVKIEMGMLPQYTESVKLSLIIIYSLIACVWLYIGTNIFRQFYSNRGK